MPKVYNKRDADIPPGAVYVGRPTKWGNPYRISKHCTREEVIATYRMFVAEPRAAEIRAELRGKDLICWCAPLPCHADVLLDIANSTP